MRLSLTQLFVIFLAVSPLWSTLALGHLMPDQVEEDMEPWPMRKRSFFSLGQRSKTSSASASNTASENQPKELRILIGEDGTTDKLTKDLTDSVVTVAKLKDDLEYVIKQNIELKGREDLLLQLLGTQEHHLSRALAQLAVIQDKCNITQKISTDINIAAFYSQSVKPPQLSRVRTDDADVKSTNATDALRKPAIKEQHPQNASNQARSVDADANDDLSVTSKRSSNLQAMHSTVESLSHDTHNSTSKAQVEISKLRRKIAALRREIENHFDYVE